MSWCRSLRNKIVELCCFWFCMGGFVPRYSQRINHWIWTGNMFFTCSWNYNLSNEKLLYEPFTKINSQPILSYKTRFVSFFLHTLENNEDIVLLSILWGQDQIIWNENFDLKKYFMRQQRKPAGPSHFHFSSLKVLRKTK